MAKQVSGEIMQIVHPSGKGQTHGKTIGPSAVAKPSSPTVPARPTPSKK